MSEPKSRRIPHPIWFAVVAVLMVALWVFLSVWLPYHREQIAIREIERVGGKVRTIWDGPEWIEAGPEWMQEIVADGWLSWFDRVMSVDLQNTQVTDEGLKHLSGMTNLTELYLSDTQISDNGLNHLRSFTNLESLHLENTQVTDEGVKELQKALPDCEIYR